METGKLKLNDQKNEEIISAQILKELKSIRYGYVQIIVQDSKVVQIERVEKFRILEKK